VISAIVKSEDAGSAECLARVLKSTLKLQAFNKYCASEPQILGIIESSKGEVSKAGSDIPAYKKNQQQWLQITTDS
jgi:hypothetical protein